MAQIAVHVSLSSKGYEPLVCASLRSRAVRHFVAALRGARRTAGDGLSSCRVVGFTDHLMPGMGP